jgi:hypothetical protein
MVQTGGRATTARPSEKGGVSVYGLGRFPVTLYKEQWTKLLAMPMTFGRSSTRTTPS